MRPSILGCLIGMMISGIALPAHAAGYFVPRADSGETADNAAGPEQAFWVEDSDETTLYIQASVRGTLTDFAWILPLPAAPTRVEEAPEDLFRLLDDLTAPQLQPIKQYTTKDSSCEGETQSIENTNLYPNIKYTNLIGLLSQKTVADFSFEVVRHSEMAEWLSQGGFAAGTVQQEAMRTYASAFLAVEVKRGKGYRLPVLALHFPKGTSLLYALQPIKVTNSTESVPFLLYAAGYNSLQVNRNNIFQLDEKAGASACNRTIKDAENALATGAYSLWPQLILGLNKEDIPKEMDFKYIDSLLYRHLLVAQKSGDKIIRGTERASVITIKATDYSEDAFSILFSLFGQNLVLARWQGVANPLGSVEDLEITSDPEEENFLPNNHKEGIVRCQHTDSGGCHLIQQYNLGLSLIGLGLAVFFAWRRRNVMARNGLAQGEDHA